MDFLILFIMTDLHPVLPIGIQRLKFGKTPVLNQKQQLSIWFCIPRDEAVDTMSQSRRLTTSNLTSNQSPLLRVSEYNRNAVL